MNVIWITAIFGGLLFIVALCIWSEPGSRPFVTTVFWLCLYAKFCRQNVT